MKPVSFLAVNCLLMTLLDLAPVGSCSDRHSSKPVKDSEVVETLEADNISVNNATLNAVIYYWCLPEYESYDYVGFELCEDKNEENVKKIIVEDIDNESEIHLSKVVEGLKTNSKYIYRAFLTCSNKHSYYGKWKYFSTLNE